MLRSLYFTLSIAAAMCSASPANGQFDDFRPSSGNASKPTASGEIQIENALIQLIDHAELASTQTGILAFEVPEEGTVVQKDQVVAQLDDTVPRASLAVAQAQASTDAEVRSAEKIVEVAESEVASAIEANSKFPNTVSTQDFNRLKLTAARSKFDVDTAKRDLEVARAKVHEAQMLLGTYEIKAPFSGVVRKRLKRNGEAVRQGDPILELVSTERLRVVARVPAQQLAAFATGRTVIVVPEFELKQGLPPLQGVVKFVDLYGEADLVKGLVDVQIEVPNPDARLIPGLQATVIAKSF